MWKPLLFLCVLLWPVFTAAGWDEAQAAYKKHDFKTAAKELRALADRGDTKAQVNLGGMYAEGQGVHKDFKQAAAWYLKAAEQGDVMGQVNLGELYISGQGVPRNYVQALKWNILAAASGDADAMRYRDTLATRMDASEIEEAKRLARAWLTKHAKGKR
jgi:TPR repeat protein